jgi:hypothetical protein
MFLAAVFLVVVGMVLETFFGLGQKLVDWVKKNTQ